MRRVWDENAGARFREMLYSARKKAMENACKQLGKRANPLDMVGRGPIWMSKDIWNELVEKYFSKDDYIEKCKQAQQNRLTEKDGSITKHTCGSIPREAHREKMVNTLKRDVDNFELFERCHKTNQGVGEFVDNKSKRISEYRAKHGCSDASSLPSFDLSSWCDVTGGPSKGRLYGFGRSQTRRTSSGSSVNSTYTREHEEKFDEISKALEDVRAKALKIVEQSRRREEESKRMIERTLEEVRKREEEARKREEEARKREKEVRKREIEAQKREEEALRREEEAWRREDETRKMHETVRKMIQEIGYTNHQYAGGSRPQEQRDII